MNVGNRGWRFKYPRQKLTTRTNKGKNNPRKTLMITSAQVGKEWVGIVAIVLSNWLQHINLKLDNQTTRPQTADIIQLKLSLLKKTCHPGQSREEFYLICKFKRRTKRCCSGGISHKERSSVYATILRLWM